MSRADSLEKEMLWTCGEGRGVSRKGRPRKWWIEEILAGTGVGLEELQTSGEEFKREEDDDCDGR